jgi:hypothetical protein
MRRRITATLALTFGLTITAWRQPDNASARALEYFEKIEKCSFDEYLKRIRPAKISPTLKAELIASLPREGEIEPSAKMRAKLAALSPVLEYFDRSSVVEFKVIRVDQVFIGLYGRSVVILTEKAIDLLSAEELQAVVAHELAHEYFWDEYELARRSHQYREVQELELRCDGVAIITMMSLGRDPKYLGSAVAKTLPSTETAMDAELLRFYPSPRERAKFMRQTIEMAKARQTIESTLVWK